MLIAMTLAGCSSSGFVSVEEKFGRNGSGSTVSRTEQAGSSDPVPSSGYHRVEKGETLYGIAWQYGLDPMALADSNGIRSPFTIFPGQQIAIRNVRRKSSGSSGNSSQVATPSQSSKPASGTPVKKSEPVVVAVPPPVVAPPVTAPIAKVPTPTVPSSESGKPVVTPVPAPVSKPSGTPAKAPGAGQWNWPASGKIVAKFSSAEPVNKGIDIAGKAGDPIAAAASGTVVYAGQGLRGYGNLVIVKHDDVYLSAYAHAQKILVKENQSIKAGQSIAEIGSTGTDSVKLHFEIRKNGKPVDPLYFLPKR
ncbi:MAG: peptigoglycan-binding protein LysM [Oceanospirillaceae bacterium]|nr:peptigoglycan-binding protein LysM [Oceanospirillaceae bacterium]|tara:strand:- start:75 stop:995 length:921 start_codon:yes stop_codon:yes gene_type:complete